MAKKHSPSNNLRLPKPGTSLKTGPNGYIFEEIEYDISRTTSEKLKALLKSYNLSTRGNKQALIDRLQDFSNDQKSWVSIYKPAQARTKGGGKNTNKRQSGTMKRIIEQFGDREVPMEFQTRKGSNQRTLSTTMMPDGMINHNDDWANKVLHSFLFSAPLATTASAQTTQVSDVPISSEQTPSTELRGVQPSVAGQVYVDPIPGGRMDGQLQEMHIKMTQMQRNMQSLVNRFANPSCPPSAAHFAAYGGMVPQAMPNSILYPSMQHASIMSGTQPSSTRTSLFTQEAMEQGEWHPMMPFTRELGLFLPQSTPPTAASTAQTSGPDSAVIKEGTHLMVYLDGEEVVFRREEIPTEPPAIHFSNNIDGLLREWHTSRRLIIGNQGIPIKCWDQIYKEKAQTTENKEAKEKSVWSVIRTEWGNWKFIVEERDQLGTDKAFWDKFVDGDGNRLSYQAILDCLKEERLQRNTDEYNEAMRVFGNRLDRKEAGNAFTYKKSGKTYLCTAEDKVAKRWRMLKAKDPMIVPRMEAILLAEQSATGIEEV